MRLGRGRWEIANGKFIQKLCITSNIVCPDSTPQGEWLFFFGTTYKGGGLDLHKSGEKIGEKESFCTVSAGTVKIFCIIFGIVGHTFG